MTFLLVSDRILACSQSTFLDIIAVSNIRDSFGPNMISNIC